MNKDALRKFYESFLPVIGLDIGSDDFLSTFHIDDEGNKIPIYMLVNNLPVIFPTDGVLREGKWTDRVGFHPLSESITRGISPMLISMKTAYTFKLYQSIFFIGAALIRVAKESREGTIKNLPANLVEKLGSLPKTVDAKSLAFFSKVMAAHNDTDQAVVKVCIKRNGSILGTDYKRTTSTYFPIYEQLVKAVEDKEGEFWGVTAARKSDVQLIKELLEIILPDVDDENRYAAGTFSPVAPYLDSFIRSAAKVQESLNSAMELLDKYLPSNIRSALQASTDWVEEMEDLRNLRNIIPPLKYNEGDITEEEQRERESDVTKHRPTHAEKSADIPDFSAKGNNTMKRAAEPRASTGAKFGRRYVDDTLTDEERRDPERAERRMSSSRYDDDDDYDYRRDRGRDSRRDDRRRDDDRRDRGRGRSDRSRDDDRRSDRGRSTGSSWLERTREREDDRRSRDRGRGRR